MPLLNVTDIDQMKDSDLLYAADLKGKAVTLDITDMSTRDFQDDEEESGDKPKRMYLLHFKQTDKKLGCNRTNQILISKMFGRNPNEWIGKKVTFWPTTVRAGGETVPCIRVYGSPQIDKDINVKTKLGRRTLKATLKAVTLKPAAETRTATIASHTTGKVMTQAWPSIEKSESKPDSEAGPQSWSDSTVLDAWAILGWTHEEGQKDLTQWENSDRSVTYLVHLNRLIDEENAREAE